MLFQLVNPESHWSLVTDPLDDRIISLVVFFLRLQKRYSSLRTWGLFQLVAPETQKSLVTDPPEYRMISLVESR